MQKYHNPKYNKYYMGLAELAASNSVSARKQVGACIVLPNGLISLGWNGQPSGMDNCCEDVDGLTKPTVIHAEINALKKLLVSGTSVKDAMVFCSYSPCLNCAVQLVDLGIKEFVYKMPYKDSSGIELLKESGVKVSLYNEVNL